MCPVEGEDKGVCVCVRVLEGVFFSVRLRMRVYVPLCEGEVTDLLKVNFFGQPNFQTDNFAQRNGAKMP